MSEDSGGIRGIRKDFPLLNRQVEGRPILYLDSAATSLKPMQVLEAERRFSTDFTANIHRGKHLLSEEASAAYEQARQQVARFIGGVPDEVVFTRNATEALNMVASGLVWEAGDKVVTLTNDHHSNQVPWMRAAEVAPFATDPTEPVDVEAFAAFVRKEAPKVVAISQASNVTGVVQPVKAICAAIADCGAIVVVDAAQSAPHMPLEVGTLGADFVAFSGHKMLGPMGTGVLWGRQARLAELEPLMLGGGTVDRVSATGYSLKKIPYRFEAGTPNVSGVLGLGEAVRYLEAIGFDAMQAHETELAEALSHTLESLPAVRVLMGNTTPRLAVGSIALLDDLIDADHLALLLSDSHKIMVRSGHHCCHPLFDRLGLGQGALRASAYLYNTVEEIERFGEALTRILRRFYG